jgi:hypothetical protein
MHKQCTLCKPVMKRHFMEKFQSISILIEKISLVMHYQWTLCKPVVKRLHRHLLSVHRLVQSAEGGRKQVNSAKQHGRQAAALSPERCVHLRNVLLSCLLLSTSPRSGPISNMIIEGFYSAKLRDKILSLCTK